ncbi:MAG: FtsX-like permease family protein, partial [Bacteroidota bacterium]
HFVDRCKEVGIRKLHGASTGHLTGRLIRELLSINILAAIVGLGLFVLAVITVHRYQVITYPLIAQTEWEQLVLILTATVAVNTLASSVYPFIFLKKIEIISALKGAGSLLKTKAFGQAGNVVRGLLIFQIVASIFFLSASLIIHRQLKLLSEQPLDAEIRMTGVFPGMSGANEQFAQLATGFLEEMSDYGTIREYAFSNLYKGQIRSEQKIMFGDTMTGFLTVVDPGIARGSNHLLEGNGFDYSFGYSPRKVILDSILAKSHFGYDDSTKLWSIKGGRYQTAGVIQRTENDVPRAFVSGFRYLTYIDLVLNYEAHRGDRLDEFLEKAEYMISTRFPYFFLMRREQEASGRAEEEVLTLFVFFGGVSVLVAAIGLFGLSYFITQKKSREVGIRKIHGASPIQILSRLLMDFARLVLIGGLLATPLVYFGGHLWLQNYARRIELDISIFLLPILGIAFVSLLTVLDKSWKAASLNPIDILDEK